MRVEPTTCAALFAEPNLDDLVAEYSAEARTEGMPDPAARLATYQALERAGMIHPFGAWERERLIGFIAVLSTLVPHYAVPLACTESFFVSKADRGSGAGLVLLARAEQKARELGAAGLLVSAPSEGSLAKLLPRCGYRDASRVFFKRFQDA